MVRWDGVVTACSQGCKTIGSLGIKSRASVRRFVNKRFDLFRPSKVPAGAWRVAGRKYFYVDGPEFIVVAVKIIDHALAGGRPK
jgi:hypothetical protein